MSLRYGPLAESDRDRFAAVLQASFNVPSPGPKAWIEREGLPVCRVLTRGKEMLGGLMILDMAQFFGGRSLECGGISAVGVAPEARGGGAARTLMEGAMRELFERKVPLSALYPATQTLYRKSGFEQAGARAEFKLNLRIYPVQDRELSLRRLPLEPSAVKACYESWARHQNGALDRRSANWSRALRPRGEETELYGVGDPLEGYLALQRLPGRRAGHQNIHLTDFIALTPRAVRRLFSFLADHRSLAEFVTWNGAPHSPMLAGLPEQHVECRMDILWMLRLVDVQAALSGRGYSPNLACEFKLAVSDELLPANARSWWVRIADGRASVEPGRSGGLKISVRALAGLYGGLFNPWQARLAGWLDWKDTELARLEGIFGAPAALADMF